MKGEGGGGGEGRVQPTGALLGQKASDAGAVIVGWPGYSCSVKGWGRIFIC